MVQLKIENNDLTIHAHHFGLEHFPQLGNHPGLLDFSELGHLYSETNLSLMCYLEKETMAQ